MENTGTKKAETILLTLEFPDEIVVIETGSEDNYERPERPKHFPSNPLAIAKRKFHENIFGVNKFIGANTVSVVNTFPSFNTGKLGKFINPNPNKYLWFEGNIVSIKVNSLMHTRLVSFEEEVEIVVLKTGNYNIKANIICEQFSEEQEFYIPVTILETDINS